MASGAKVYLGVEPEVPGNWMPKYQGMVVFKGMARNIKVDMVIVWQILGQSSLLVVS